MKMKILVMQRKNSYPGENAPEVLAVADEYLFDDNPAWWEEEVIKHKTDIGNEADAWAEMLIEVDDHAINNALYPNQDVVEAHVINPT